MSISLCFLRQRVFFMHRPAQGSLLLCSMRAAQRVGEDESFLLDWTRGGKEVAANVARSGAAGRDRRTCPA